MSGHNKWSKIKHKKAATDAKKSKIFGKYARLISVEAKRCGGDVTSPSLKMAIDRARKENMPSDNIDRAIKKANETADVTEVLFETYGPGGCGILVTALTDNNNRTGPEIKHLLSEQGFSLATPGSVSWNFTKNKETGEWDANTTIAINEEESEKLENLIDALEDHDDVQEIYVSAE
ncbi:MAG: YebC/PmpR family DNA-binding regulatory protein [Flavobacteriaceae bacterium]|jgi:YebC/PmpR family DNA-binding regulatory protein